MVLHVKLGSLRTDDPQAAIQTAYSRALGAPRLLWCEPTARPLRDELSPAVRRYRVWASHEVFAFDNTLHALAMLTHFSTVSRPGTDLKLKPPFIAIQIGLSTDISPHHYRC